MAIHEMGDGYCGSITYGTCSEAFHVALIDYYSKWIMTKVYVSIKDKDV